MTRKRSGISVLYKDEALAAFDKPAGIPVSPDRWNPDLDHFMRIAQAEFSSECRNAHRLDRDTSGVLVCAMTLGAYKNLSGQFLARKVAKTYLALVRNPPASDRGMIDQPIGRDPARPGLMKCSPEGKESRTEYEVIGRWAPYFALLRLFPQTGRTHQIRVHLAHAGSPVIADPLYGDGRPLLLSSIKKGYKHRAGPEKPLMARSALHAESIAFAHPATGLKMTISAPMPLDFEISIKYLRKFAGTRENGRNPEPAAPGRCIQGLPP